MELYLLIHVQGVNICNTNVSLFLDKEQARKVMQDDWAAMLNDLGFTELDKQTGERNWRCEDDTASIRDDLRFKFSYWKIEEHHLPIDVAVKVCNGRVECIISNASVNVDVYDLDSPEYLEDKEETEADQTAREFDALLNRPGWHEI